MRKSYFYKFFNPSDTYQPFYEEGFDIATIPNYTWSINGGKGALELQVVGIPTDFQNYFIENSTYRVELICHDKETPAQGELIYTGTLVDQAVTLRSNGFIDISPFLYISGENDLSNKVVENTITGATSISYSNEDVADIIRDLLDKYSLKGGYVTYDSSSLEDTNIPISITIKNEYYLESINRLIGYLPRGWHWYIDGANKFHLHFTDLDVVDHEVYLGKEAVGGQFKISFGEMTNGIFFHGGDTGGGTKLYKKYSNSTSQSNFGVFEKILSDERVTNADTAENRANREIEKGSSPIRYLEAEIVDSNGSAGGYDIESLKPGQVIQILSSEIPTQFTYWYNDAGTQGNMLWDLSFWNYNVDASLGVPFQIQSIEYQGDRAIIKCSDVLADLATTVEQLEFRQLLKETVDSPNSPS